MSRDTYVRNLDQIQEREGSERGLRLGTLVLVSLGAGFLAFGALALARVPKQATPPPPDPLGELLAKTNAQQAMKKPGDLPDEITFPGILSDAPEPTTALVAMRKDAKNADAVAALNLPPGAPTVPPPATDRLPVVPLPAQNVAAASPIVTRPRDALTQMATEASASALEKGAEGTAEAGKPGGYQLQASSFRSEAEAQAFANALRQRGHRAHVERAEIPNRGTWYRVRIGPFRSRAEARAYRAQFEQKEQLVPYLVEPGK